jgi:hypothetical protein
MIAGAVDHQTPSTCQTVRPGALALGPGIPMLFPHLVRRLHRRVGHCVAGGIPPIGAGGIAPPIMTISLAPARC